MSDPRAASTSGSVPFEFTMSLPNDARFADTARELAVHAAKHAGCSDARADAFGDTVERAVRSQFAAGADGGAVPVVVRRTAGPLEILINGQTLAVDPGA